MYLIYLERSELSILEVVDAIIAFLLDLMLIKFNTLLLIFNFSGTHSKIIFAVFIIFLCSLNFITSTLFNIFLIFVFFIKLILLSIFKLLDKPELVLINNSEKPFFDLFFM